MTKKQLTSVLNTYVSLIEMGVQDAKYAKENWILEFFAQYIRGLRLIEHYANMAIYVLEDLEK